MTRSRAFLVAIGLAAVTAVAARVDVRALNVSLSRADMTRALELARWPHTDAERIRFHDRYLTLIDTRVSPLTVTSAPVVAQVEIVTPFRRAELLAEEHARAGDSFGLGGTDEAFKALKPWLGTVGVDAYVQIPGCDPDCWLPPIAVTVAGVGTAPASTAARGVFYTHSGATLAPGTVVEATFDAAAIGQTTREVRVVVAGRELARVAIDFASLE